MNCHNCGAPMELFERRRYFCCRHCGSFHFLDAPEVDGLQVLTQGDGGRPCAVCSSPLARALLDRTAAVDYCQRCRGVLLERHSFADLVRHRRAWAPGAPFHPPPLDQRELQRVVTCPSCRRKMDVHPYYGPGNVVIDSCGACDLIWLDFGELKQIVDAPGRDRGKGDPVPERPDLRGQEHDDSPRRMSGRISLDDLLDLFD